MRTVEIVDSQRIMNLHESTISSQKPISGYNGRHYHHRIFTPCRPTPPHPTTPRFFCLMPSESVQQRAPVVPAAGRFWVPPGGLLGVRPVTLLGASWAVPATPWGSLGSVLAIVGWVLNKARGCTWLHLSCSYGVVVWHRARVRLCGCVCLLHPVSSHFGSRRGSADALGCTRCARSTQPSLLGECPTHQP